MTAFTSLSAPPLLFCCSKVPLAATGLPVHAAPAGEVGEPALGIPGCFPASDETWAESVPQQPAAQPRQTSGRCSSCEKATQDTAHTFARGLWSSIRLTVVPGAWGKRNEGMRRHCVSVCDIKAQGVEFLLRKPYNVLRPKNVFLVKKRSINKLTKTNKRHIVSFPTCGSVQTAGLWCVP